MERSGTIWNLNVQERSARKVMNDRTCKSRENFMENLKNSIFVHEDFEKWPCLFYHVIR
jgi:hypothetical protein